ncbi:unnamed protein product [Protopolystoma xenopodis]|uniref:Uncharacterized protein n=1 Tax=Protopolystoma xenopodis TaxID=117903 RepID=A0A3S5BV88_9PLAT|nr:unnamed protein product [Protopolystoma xenopodis]
MPWHWFDFALATRSEQQSNFMERAQFRALTQQPCRFLPSGPSPALQSRTLHQRCSGHRYQVLQPTKCP